MFKLSTRGSFKNLEKFLNDTRRQSKIHTIMHQCGEEGVSALQGSTPMDSGETAKSWYYTVDETKYGYRVSWHNDNATSSGTPIALLIQYGHGTRNGGYVQGYDYINPALRPVFEDMAQKLWEAVR